MALPRIWTRDDREQFQQVTRVRESKPGPPDCTADVLTTRPRCLLIQILTKDWGILCDCHYYFWSYRRFSSSVQENLRRGEGDLSDLVAINIKRGRDRGAPGYIIYRNLKLCNLTEVKSFRDLEKKAGFYPKDVANLKKIYKGRIEDIDLFTGG